MLSLYKSAFDKIRSLSGEMSTKYLPLYLTHRLITSLTGSRARIEAFIIVAQPVPTTPLLSPRRAADINIFEIQSGDPRLSQLPRPTVVIADRFLQGAHCFIAQKNGTVIGCLWIVLDSYDEDMARLCFKLPASGYHAWDFDVYVAPEHRLGFTFLKLWDGANSFLRERGIAFTLSRISAFNRQSLASHSRLGAHQIGWVTVFILGPLEIMFSSCRPWLSLSWGSRRPVLRLPTPSH